MGIRGKTDGDENGGGGVSIREGLPLELPHDRFFLIREAGMV